MSGPANEPGVPTATRHPKPNREHDAPQQPVAEFIQHPDGKGDQESDDENGHHVFANYKIGPYVHLLLVLVLQVQ